MKMPKFKQLQMFASEIVLLLDRGNTEDISKICDVVEAGKIVDYISTKYGFQNRDIDLHSICDMNEVLAKFYVSESEARVRGIDSNGLAFLLQIALEMLSMCMYQMKFNDINPDLYSDYFN